jgi:hypothetical protein
MSTSFVKLVADSLVNERFTLIDIGCSGGIDETWRLFGSRLAAIGFDASVSECRRLASQETNPNVRYMSGFVDIPPDHPFVQLDGKKWRGHVGSFYEETSSRWTRELRAERLRNGPDSEKWKYNLWGETELADPDKPLYMPQTLTELGLSDIDVLKIDVDGPDFRVLNSFDGLFAKLGIVAARMEVNLYGSADPTDHTFHNTDRFMRRQGYNLVRLDCGYYSKRALPARYLHIGASSTVTGRIFQAEAHYALVPTNGNGRRLALSLTAEKLMKLAAIFSIWNQPDGAAEILIEFRDRIAPLIDVDAALDLLAAQTQAHVGTQQPLPYRDYMALFATDSPHFFPQAPSPTPEPSFLNETLDAAIGDRLPDTFLAMPRLQDGATVRGQSNRLHEAAPLTDVMIDTTIVPYVYSMLWKLDAAILPPREHDCSIVVEASVDVGAGRLGILWVDEDYQPIEESERFVVVDPHRQQVLVSAPATRARHLVFRNLARVGLATSFIVRGLRGKIAAR